MEFAYLPEYANRMSAHAIVRPQKERAGPNRGKGPKLHVISSEPR